MLRSSLIRQVGPVIFSFLLRGVATAAEPSDSARLPDAGSSPDGAMPQTDVAGSMARRAGETVKEPTAVQAKAAELSKAPGKQPTPPPSANASWDAVESRMRPPVADGFAPRLGALLQVEYLGRATENHLSRRLDQMAAPLGPPPSAQAASTPFLDESTLLLRRARLSADGGSGALGYFVEVEMGEAKIGLLEYRLRAPLGRGFALNVGQMRVPFSRSWLIRENDLIFPERSIATDQFRYDYDIGVSVEGNWQSDRVRLILGGFNGGGRILARNDNLDPMLVLRAEWQPVGVAGPRVEGSAGTKTPSLTIGGAASADYVPVPGVYGYLSGTPQPPLQLVVDANRDGLPDGITVVQGEVDLTASYRGFGTEAEAYLRYEGWHDIPANESAAGLPFAPRTSYAGFFSQVSRSLFAGRAEVGARVSFTQLSPISVGGTTYDPHLCISANATSYSCNLPYANERLELSGVLVYQIIPGVLQVDGMYSFFDWKGTAATPPPDPVEQRAIVLLQLFR